MWSSVSSEGDLEETRGRLGMAEQKVQRLEETEKPLQDRLYKQSAEMSKIVMEVAAVPRHCDKPQIQSRLVKPRPP
eukprot:953683-Amphidinium_carterae.1